MKLLLFGFLVDGSTLLVLLQYYFFFTTVSSHLELKLWCQHESCSNILAHVRKGQFGMVFKGLESYPVLFSMNGALYVNVKFFNNFFYILYIILLSDIQVRLSVLIACP